MTGERRNWYRVASHLKIPVIELQARITYSEFLEWLVFLEKTEVVREAKHELYLAQIAAECRRMWTATPKKVKLEDFLIELGVPPEVQKKQQRAKQSKDNWMKSLNLK